MKAPQDSLIPLEAFVFVGNGEKLLWIYAANLRTYLKSRMREIQRFGCGRGRSQRIYG
jgi:hypothetical protein